MGRSQHTLSWRVHRATEAVSVQQPLIMRTGPAWAFGLMGVGAELLLAPVVLGLTIAVGIGSYLLLDTPSTHIRAQQRPRFVSVRILYLNTVIVAGFWLAVMFTFSAADPAVSNEVGQRLPALLDVATASAFKSLAATGGGAQIHALSEAVASTSTWFDVFLHGLVCALALNFLLYGVVIARRRFRARHMVHGRSRKSLRYDSTVGLFVDDDPGAQR